MEFILTLKDPKQKNMVLGTDVLITESSGLLIQGNEYKKRFFRLPKNNFTSGMFWVDPIGSSLLVELMEDTQVTGVYNIFLGEDFDNLFPNAAKNWGAYFFKLHYST